MKTFSSSIQTKDVLEGETKKFPLLQFYLPSPAILQETNDTFVLVFPHFDVSSYEVSQTNIKIYLLPPFYFLM